MDEEKRINGGYEIMESCTIGNNELVIGHNAKAPNPYVCWYCKDGSDYFWGYYCNQLSEAREKLMERYQRECHMPYNNPPSQGRVDHLLRCVYAQDFRRAESKKERKGAKG